MKLTDLMYYGRYYRDEREPNHTWWFDPNNKQIFLYDDLLKTFGYNSLEDIINFSEFIPLFETDIIKLEHQFISETQTKKVMIFFKDIADSDFDREFKIFIEKESLIGTWHDFEKKNLYKDALKWCDENHIKGIEIE